MDAGLKTYQSIAEQTSRDELIVSHLKYVKHILGKLLIDFPTAIDVENLEAAGILGLVEAANRFSPERGIDFKTFAYQRIRGAVFDELRRNCPLPQQILKNWTLIREAFNELQENVSPESISKHTGLSVEDVETCLTAIRMTKPTSWHDELEPESRSDKKGEVDAEDRKQILVQAIEDLPGQMREIITLYHMDQLTLKQIGQVVNLSESRVSRILASAELKLKQELIRKKHSQAP